MTPRDGPHEQSSHASQPRGGAPAPLVGPDSTWFAALEKPGIYPPPVVFGVGCTALFTLQAAALWLVLRTAPDRDRRAAVGPFVLQLPVNLTWTSAFFTLRNLAVALGVVVLLFVVVAATAAAFARVDRRRRSCWLRTSPGWRSPACRTTGSWC